MASGEVSPVYLIADRYVGWLKAMVPLTGMTAVLACFRLGPAGLQPHAVRPCP